ncbi:MAG: bifunctional riboflavin kinase/FAD synthetase [Armatimonadetes bacterium]|nr:bifunctional riboflavin kinase/FAD synthetase [Armatimonadota bacterium]
MQIVVGADAFEPTWPSSVVCMGVFDGVHLGHQEVIRAAVSSALGRGLPSVVATFDRHPASVLRPERCPPAIASLDANLRYIERLGADVALVIPFTADFSRIEPERFLEEVLVGKLRASQMVVGHDFAFGHERRGTAEWLAGQVETRIIQPFLHEGMRVSSSHIRELIAAGDVEAAGRLLGRPFELEGIVVEGAKVGRTLGYPTANLAIEKRQAIPDDGAYGGFAVTPFGAFRAAISIGNRPTFNGQARTIEAYLLDYPGDSLYGRHVRFGLLSRLHPQVRFESVQGLKAQIEEDVALVRGWELSHVL